MPAAPLQRLAGPGGGDGGLVARRGRNGPVLGAVTVKVAEFDGGVFAIHADVRGFARREQRVDDRRGRAVFEADERGGEVLGRRGPGLPRGDCVHLVPWPQEVQEEIELVDAVAHRGPTALRFPRAAPRKIEILIRPVPQRVAAGYEGSSEIAATNQTPCSCRGVTEAVLEDARELGAARGLCGVEPVEVGKAECRRLLGQDVHTGLKALDRLVNVHHGRSTQVHDVRFGLGQQLREVLVAAGDPMLIREGLQACVFDIARGDQRRSVVGAGQVGRVNSCDPACSDDGHPVSLHMGLSVERKQLCPKVSDFLVSNLSTTAHQ
ncbi:hypothetical protein PJL18_00919 [Paenarthrobacter nicotinovorans]|nr:hypothetical protein [Paenarthrobacter nicotinovorans]